MKFKDIKVEDIVFIREEVRYGFNRIKFFFIPHPVIKVTRTQFSVKDSFDNIIRFKKDNGSEVGGRGYAYHEGEKINWSKNDTVCSQIDEMHEFKKKVKLAISVRELSDDLRNATRVSFMIESLTKDQIMKVRSSIKDALDILSSTD